MGVAYAPGIADADPKHIRKWYFYILNLWDGDGERDILISFFYLSYAISLVDHVEHHSFLQHVFLRDAMVFHRFFSGFNLGTWL